MTVYWEYSFLENFALDGLLLYLSLRCARCRPSCLRLILSSAVGGAEAVLFPLFPLPVWASYIVKVLGGALLVLLAIRKKEGKRIPLVLVFFFGLTFALGGALVAAYSFFRIEYIEGNGYLVERVPVGLLFAGAGFFAIAVFYAVKKMYRFCKTERSLVPVTLFGTREVHWKGYADSGNCLMFRGKPVCVLSAAALYALLGREGKPIGRMEVGTVHGAKEASVYECRRMTVGDKTFEGVPLVVGELKNPTYSILLHTAYTEGYHETSHHVEDRAQEISGKRERRPLSLRKRGAPLASFGRRRGDPFVQIGSGGRDRERQGKTDRT